MKAKTFVSTAVLLMLAMVGSAIAQKDKKWTDWNKKEAQKIIDDSPWAKIQTDTDTNEMMFSPTNRPGTSSDNDRRAGVGAVNQSMSITYYVRFFSARPIRQGLARMMELT